MKQILLATAILSVLSCQDKTPQDKRTENAIKWIETHKRPIQVETFIYDKSMRTYTLFSADNKMYNTGAVDLELPLLITDSVKVPESIVITNDYSDFREQLKDLQDLKASYTHAKEVLNKD